MWYYCRFKKKWHLQFCQPIQYCSNLTRNNKGSLKWIQSLKDINPIEEQSCQNVLEYQWNHDLLQIQNLHHLWWNSGSLSEMLNVLVFTFLLQSINTDTANYCSMCNVHIIISVDLFWRLFSSQGKVFNLCSFNNQWKPCSLLSDNVTFWHNCNLIITVFLMSFFFLEYAAFFFCHCIFWTTLFSTRKKHKDFQKSM